MAQDFPFQPVVRLEMSPVYTDLRKNEPMARVRMPYGGEAWLVTKLADIKKAYTDPRFSRAATLGRDIPRMTPTVDENLSLLSMDPPDHTRIRKLVAAVFTGRAAERKRQRTQEIVDDLLDRMLATGPPADLHHVFSLPTSIMVICELLGVPFEDREKFTYWSDKAMSMEAEDLDSIEVNMGHLRQYLSDLATRRETEPSEDILGTLVAARDELGRIDHEEIVMFGVLTLMAGHETVANAITNSVYTLLTHPDQLAKLRADETLLPKACEEFFRFLPSTTGTGIPRVALEDVELGGVLIRAGETVLMDEPCANRDEDVFDRADELDITRERNPHIAFGFGIHHCLGAHLARMELQVALGSLLRRLPDLRFETSAEDIRFREGHLMRCVHALPIVW